MAEKKGENWVELARVIPWHESDYAPAKLMPETFRDEDGKPRTDMEPPPLEPHIILQDLNSPEKDTKLVKIPKREYEAIRKMLETGELLPEELSHLPLRDLVPSVAEQLSDEGHRRSGARRGVAFTADGAVAQGSGVNYQPTTAPNPNDRGDQ
jgi:hypothetical protein